MASILVLFDELSQPVSISFLWPSSGRANRAIARLNWTRNSKKSIIMYWESVQENSQFNTEVVEEHIITKRNNILFIISTQLTPKRMQFHIKISSWREATKTRRVLVPYQQLFDNSYYLILYNIYFSKSWKLTCVYFSVSKIRCGYL